MATNKLTRSAPPRPALVSPARHRAKCGICRHPHRDAIEDDFIRWRSPRAIALDFQIPDHSTVYRHAHATGLFARRKQNLRFILENLMERVEDVHVTANSVIRALEVYACLTDDNQWVRPPQRVLVTYETSANSAGPEATQGSASNAPVIAIPLTIEVPLGAPHAPRVTVPLIATPRHTTHEPTH